ncbi:hypothetical protein LCGC14_1560370 [marine sediment metagenome]|uniref:Uncharacterized protein n=1 Tax=marine sediment metagenome TaxID=412755 RepID=A0A0F9IMN4_9ZZZZ
MALKLLQSGIQPLGQFDALDAQTTSVLGGEVASFTYVSIVAGTDVAASDISDGYVASADTRPAATVTLSSGMRPLFLVDEGTTSYGTLFGEIVGSAVGRTVTGGTSLGPHTAQGSGKWTLWDKPGLYAVTLDAVDTTLNSGLVPTNPALTGGDALYATSAGLLTPDAASAFQSVVVGRFIEFTGDGSLVNSTIGLVQALNSPSGTSVAPGAQFTQAVIHWNPELS